MCHFDTLNYKTEQNLWFIHIFSQYSIFRLKKTYFLFLNLA